MDLSDLSVGMSVIVQWYTNGNDGDTIHTHEYNRRDHPKAMSRFIHGKIVKIVEGQYFVKYGDGIHPEKRWESGKTREAWPLAALTKKKEPSPIDDTAVLNAAAAAERRAEQALVLQHKWMWAPYDSCSSDEELSEDT
tara:strand:- start:853 stop:1266 length:414 start_codon:yes stop_codon:yes gene_type:complete